MKVSFQSWFETFTKNRPCSQPSVVRSFTHFHVISGRAKQCTGTLTLRWHKNVSNACALLAWPELTSEPDVNLWKMLCRVWYFSLFPNVAKMLTIISGHILSSTGFYSGVKDPYYKSKLDLGLVCVKLRQLCQNDVVFGLRERLTQFQCTWRRFLLAIFRRIIFINFITTKICLLLFSHIQIYITHSISMLIFTN